MDQKLKQLDARLAHLSSKYPAQSYVFDCNENNILNEETLNRYKKNLNTGSGVIIITNVVSENDIRSIQKHITDCVETMYSYRNLSSIDRTIENGFGAVGFGFLYHHYSLTEDVPKTSIEGTDTYFSLLPIHHEVTMRLMCDNAPLRTYYLMSLCHGFEQSAMISWSSCKIVDGGNFKSMRTVEHIDWYDVGDNKKINRIQAIINDDNDTKLMFVPYTWDPIIMQLLADLEGKPNFFHTNGFKVIKNTRVWQIIDRYAVAPPPKSMVIWRSGIIHFEAKTEKKQGDMHLYCVKCREPQSSDRRLRFTIGTHKPHDSDGRPLKMGTLKKLAVLASKYAIPNYNNKINQFSKIYFNIVNPKQSYEGQPRHISQKERVLLTEAFNANVDETFNALPSLYKHLYGIPQPFDSLGF